MPSTHRPNERSHHRRVFIQSITAVLASILILVFTSCKRSEPSTVPREDKLVVFAAASLRDVFTVMGDDFKRSHPGVEITFNFAGTQELRTQLEHGATVDVFASADQRHTDELLWATRVAAPATFARNEPVVVVAKEQTATLRAFADLPLANRVVIGTPEVPIGRYTLQILDRASQSSGSDFRTRVEAKVVSRELNVRQVLAKVSLGEADAGIVYRTDAITAQERLGTLAIPPEVNVIADYPIAIVSGAPHPGLARDWVQFVLSTAGQQALQRAGFIAPSGSVITR
jgi:molybdate transport system substrate-binding protein